MIVGSLLMLLGMLLIVGVLEVDYAQAIKGAGGLSARAMRAIVCGGGCIALGGVIVILIMGGVW